jgi:hypothetical protein
MGTRKLTPADLDCIRDVAKRWGKIIVRHAFGEQGPGLDVDMDQMEEVSRAAAQGLAAGTMESATFQQANSLGAEHVCPACGKVCSIKHEERIIQGLDGPFQHDEPVCYCSTCRRDFFPSASDSED